GEAAAAAQPATGHEQRGAAGLVRPIAAACVLSALLAAHARPAAQSIAVRGPYPAVVRTGEAAAVVVVVDGADAPVFGALPAVDGPPAWPGGGSSSRPRWGRSGSSRSGRARPPCRRSPRPWPARR